MPGSLRTNDDMRIDDIGRPSAREQSADYCCVGPIKRDEIRIGVTNEPGQVGLSSGIANHPRQGRGRNCNSNAPLSRSCEQDKYPAVVSLDSNQSAGVKRDPSHAGFLPLPAFRGFAVSIASAHARSLSVNGPPSFGAPPQAYRPNPRHPIAQRLWRV